MGFTSGARMRELARWKSRSKGGGLSGGRRAQKRRIGGKCEADDSGWFWTKEEILKLCGQSEDVWKEQIEQRKNKNLSPNISKNGRIMSPVHLTYIDQNSRPPKMDGWPTGWHHNSPSTSDPGWVTPVLHPSPCHVISGSCGPRRATLAAWITMVIGCRPLGSHELYRLNYMYWLGAQWFSAAYWFSLNCTVERFSAGCEAFGRRSMLLFYLFFVFLLCSVQAYRCHVCFLKRELYVLSFLFLSIVYHSTSSG